MNTPFIEQDAMSVRGGLECGDYFCGILDCEFDPSTQTEQFAGGNPFRAPYIDVSPDLLVPAARIISPPASATSARCRRADIKQKRHQTKE